MDIQLVDTGALALLPGPQDIAFFQEHGYWVSPVMLPGGLLDAAEKGMRRFYAGDHDTTLPDVPGTRGWLPEHGDVLRKNDYASLRVRELAELVNYPLIGAAAAALAGVSGIRLWHDQLLCKPVDRANTPTRVGWHTDRQYWQSCSSQLMLTAWVGYHDVDEGNGGLSFLPGSHRWNIEGLDFFSQDTAALEAAITAQGFEVSAATPRLGRGQVSFHHCRTVHGSGPNRGVDTRRSLAIHMQPDDNRYQRHADGSPSRHPNDDLVRTVADEPDYTDPDVCPRLWPRP